MSTEDVNDYFTNLVSSLESDLAQPPLAGDALVEFSNDDITKFRTYALQLSAFLILDVSVWEDDSFKLAKIALKYLHRTAGRIPAVLQKEDDAEPLHLLVFVRLVTFSVHIFNWSYSSAQEERQDAARNLGEVAVGIAAHVLCTLPGSMSRRAMEMGLEWSELRRCLSLCATYVNDLLNGRKNETYPLQMAFDVVQTDPYVLGVKNAPQSAVIILSGTHEADIAAVSLIDIFVGVLHHSSDASGLLAGFEVQTHDLALLAWERIRRFPAPGSKGAARSTALTCRLLQLSHRILQDRVAAPLPLSMGDVCSHIERLTGRRLLDGYSPTLEELDHNLGIVWEVLPTQYISHPTHAIDVCWRTDWSDVQKTEGLRSALYSYLLRALPFCTAVDLSRLKGSLPEQDSIALLARLRAAIEVKLQASLSPSGTLSSVKKRKRDESSVGVETLAFLKVFDMGEFAINDFDEEHRVVLVDNVSAMFTKPLETSPDQRYALAEAVAWLPCFLCHDIHSCIPTSGTENAASSFLSLYVHACLRLLAGKTEDVPSRVWTKLLHGMRKAVRHSNIDTLSYSDQELFGLVKRALERAERSVRIAAGNVIAVVLARHMEVDSFVLPKSNVWISVLIDIANGHGKPSIRETALVGLGSVGKVVSEALIERILTCLISHLADQNTLLRALAYTQLQAIVQAKSTTAYMLLMPHMSHVSVILVENLPVAPNMLSEACQFMGRSPTDFLSLTLHHTLPPLFAAGRKDVLQILARDLGKSIPQLAMGHESRVLAQIFLCPTEVQTDAGIEFLRGVISEAAKGAPIDLTGMVKGWIVELVSELVIVLGDHEAKKSKMAIEALKKVEKLLATPAKGQRRAPTSDLSSFLKSYMLGIISRLNDMLHELHGRKPDSFKCQVVRGIGSLIELVGPSVSSISPQIMATLQGALPKEALRESVLATWRTFITRLSPDDIGPYIGQTSAAFVTEWANFSNVERNLAYHTLDHIIEHGHQFPDHIKDVVSLQGIPDLRDLEQRLVQAQAEWDIQAHLHKLLHRTMNENSVVGLRALEELKTFMLANAGLISSLSSGDTFDPVIGLMVNALLKASTRDGDSNEATRHAAYECFGILGAMDPDRFEFSFPDATIVMLRNFSDEDENIKFVLYLLQDLLVGAYRSTSDTKYQSHLAFAIQELLKICHFGPDLVISGAQSAISGPIRGRWNSLPKYVLETVTPLLEGRFSLENRSSDPQIRHPVYPNAPTYREWIQVWTTHLISRISAPEAKKIFAVFRSAVRNQDVGVAHRLLPHIVLNILLTGHDSDRDRVREEIISVLDDQVHPKLGVAADRRMLCAQTIFSLMDHISRWIRLLRQDTSQRRAESTRQRHGGHVTAVGHEADEQLACVESLLSSIDPELMARAALNCKYYARSLLSFEQRIVALKENEKSSRDLQPYYECLHQIYAELDEPDGMAGISTMVLSPSLEHQIREHEAVGNWTSAQSCWEVKLQSAPDDLASHIGLLRCLRNLGHYDTLRTHVKGVLSRIPDWTSALAGFQIEGAWIVGDWLDVKALSETACDSSELYVARLLLAIQMDDQPGILSALSSAREYLGDHILSAGRQSYRGSYDVVIGLHVLQELDMICITGEHSRSATLRSALGMADLSTRLAKRFDSILPTFRAREPIQSMRRTAFALKKTTQPSLAVEIGKSWLTTARIARKAGYLQTAYSATLQAQKYNAPFAFIQTSKLLRVNGEPVRALQDLENAMEIYKNVSTGPPNERISTADPETTTLAKAFSLQARWMVEADRFTVTEIANKFSEASKQAQRLESPYFHVGHFWDETYTQFSADDKLKNSHFPFNTCKAYGKALSYGSKYIYQTMPRMLSLWLDLADQDRSNAMGRLGESTQQIVLSTREKITEMIDKIHRRLPAWQWLTAFPQLISRIIHPSSSVFQVLLKIMAGVLVTYPQQALWLLTSASKSKREERAQRCKAVYSRAQAAPGPSRDHVGKLIAESIKMTTELLNLADYNLGDNVYTMSISRQCRELRKITPSHLILPLQESMTVTLPPASADQDQHKPFPHQAPIIHEFLDEVEVMKSLAKPRKLTIKANDGRTYWFLCKPKDDLRKDARLMDFNSMINKLLKKDSESRRRKLHIRTYGVIPLNEECGLLEWVPNTTGLRHILAKSYEARKMKIYNNDIATMLDKERYNGKPGIMFEKQLLPMFPPVFHEWFLAMFPEPTAWLNSRLSYGRTAAVMSMVGYVLGLGDRHGENILFDSTNGDAVHVDFNCLFEKGTTLEVPERVPFRLTQNMVDGLGVTGVEGVFRIACELTMGILRNHKDSLMSVLEAFVHDPLSEFEEEKRRQDQQAKQGRSRRGANVSAATTADGRAMQLRDYALKSLLPIESKLKGVYSSKQMTTRNQVDVLIREATDPTNLGMMYVGWAAWL
ncbi:hypothetical protein DACRYDRAFT_112961 [Dacryopinax primogenitus]|uniref:non-specific serine/threonine protein kinase n=1 Tax=Dacryopinax primogenitus (strain DJM 731) TaxID=1858805 RepID=M5GBA8_DACPD|nr:uncharacterized protein DACRYDRAFT_112961 [Dacryopinax primogenitus]EJU06214.1 hypothetical protein DACRYDRAFT_112961 [Dacryopinax primogenitus]